MTPDHLALLLQWAGLGLFAAASLQDLAYRLVPNTVPGLIAGLGLALRLLGGTVLPGLAAAATVFVLAALCWRRGWLGGADVKLFGAGALLVPPGAAAGFVLATCLAGGVLAIAYWALGRLVAPPPPERPRARLARLARVERRRLRRGGPLPYALALASGACFILAGG